MKEDGGYTAKEIWVMIKSAYARVLPIVFGFVIGYFIIFFLLRVFWLKV